METSRHIQKKVLAWYQQHGRKNLPWQIHRDPYCVWVSEIMLQQTQVRTVIPYYERFMQRFPTVQALADATQDEVLSHWAGLGYYARGRNLHRAAKIITHEFVGHLPETVTQLQQLPGIGRSTAGAIRSLGHGLPASILDGNVKRVLSRCHAVSGAPNRSNTQQKLWELAEYYTPEQNHSEYNQAMMDIGAAVCTRQPQCSNCPLQANCQAYATDSIHAFPEKNIRKPLATREAYFLILHNAKDQILLEKRPPVGIWGGLWCLPECATDQDVIQHCQESLQLETTGNILALPPMIHTFTHYKLKLLPRYVPIKTSVSLAQETPLRTWLKNPANSNKGLPRPIEKLLSSYP